MPWHFAALLDRHPIACVGTHLAAAFGAVIVASALASSGVTSLTA